MLLKRATVRNGHAADWIDYRNGTYVRHSPDVDVNLPRLFVGSKIFAKV